MAVEAGQPIVAYQVHTQLSVGCHNQAFQVFDVIHIRLDVAVCGLEEMTEREPRGVRVLFTRQLDKNKEVIGIFPDAVGHSHGVGIDVPKDIQLATWHFPFQPKRGSGQQFQSEQTQDKDGTDKDGGEVRDGERGHIERRLVQAVFDLYQLGFRHEHLHGRDAGA